MRLQNSAQKCPFVQFLLLEFIFTQPSAMSENFKISYLFTTSTIETSITEKMYYRTIGKDRKFRNRIILIILIRFKIDTFHRFRAISVFLSFPQCNLSFSEISVFSVFSVMQQLFFLTPKKSSRFSLPYPHFFVLLHLAYVFNFEKQETKIK